MAQEAVSDEHTDFADLMRQLKAAGWSLRRLSVPTGIHKDRLANIAHGAPPLYWEGVVLLSVHSDATAAAGSSRVPG